MANTGIEEKVAEDAKVISPTIQECLSPLLAKRDQIESEETELREKIKGMRETLYEKGDERKDMEKVLRSAGMISSDPRPKSEHNEPQFRGSLLEPHLENTPTNPRTIQAWERVSKAIEDMEGEPFQISMIEKRCGASRGTVERVIGMMRGEEKVRLLGKQPPLGREHPGGAKAVTFQEINR